MTDNKYFIFKCTSIIEQQLGWGNSQSWQSKDYENLSKLIFEATSVVLSTSTLKRLWGRVAYSSTPNLSTLDALARFAGHAHWRAFVHNIGTNRDPFAEKTPEDEGNTSQKQTESEDLRADISGTSLGNVDGIGKPETSSAMPAKRDHRKKSPRRKILIIVLCLTAISLAAVFLLRPKEKKPLVYDNILFSSRPVTTGVPNTVIFNYNVSNSNADSVFIQQNWDVKRRFKVNKEGREYTSTYYLPGYYRAKLVLDNTILKEHDVLIETKQWIGLFQKDPIPVYLSDELVYQKSFLGINGTNIESPAYREQAPQFILTHVNKKDFNVPSDSFTLKVKVRNTSDHFNTPCRRVSCMLIGTKGVIIVPLSRPGCVGELKVRLGEKVVDGRINDLSGLGVDCSEFVSLKCVSKSGMIRFFLGDNLAFESSFKQEVGRIVGVRFSFDGAGGISDFKIK